jgi:integrase
VLDSARNGPRTTRRGQPLGPATERNLLIAIRAVLGWGVKQGHLTKNVGTAVDLPAEGFVERPVMTAELVRALLDAVRDSEIATIVAVAIGTGLRRSDLCALRWGDIDLRAGIIHVRRSVAVLNGKILVKAPKTKSSQRSDHVPAFVVAALRAHYAEQATRHLALGLGNRGPEGVVFDRRTGEVWNPNELSKQFSRLVRRKGLPLFRFHDLRHGYASLAFAAGVPLKVVSESLGHSGIAITSKTYVHLLDDLKREKATASIRTLRPM